MNKVFLVFPSVLVVMLLLFATNIFAQKRVEPRGIILKNSIDIRSIPTVILAELEEHSAKLKLLK